MGLAKVFIGLGLENLATFGAASELVCRKPAADKAYDATGNGTGYSATRATNNANASTVDGTGSRSRSPSCATSNEALPIVVVEYMFASRSCAGDVGHSEKDCVPTAA